MRKILLSLTTLAGLLGAAHAHAAAAASLPPLPVTGMQQVQFYYGGGDPYAAAEWREREWRRREWERHRYWEERRHWQEERRAW